MLASCMEPLGGSAALDEHLLLSFGINAAVCAELRTKEREIELLQQVRNPGVRL